MYPKYPNIMKYHNYCAVQVKARQLQSQAESSVTEADVDGGCRRLAKLNLLRGQ